MFSEDIIIEMPQCVTNMCRHQHCDFTLPLSSTAAAVSKPKQFLELFEVCKQMYYFENRLILFEEINEKCRESYMRISDSRVPIILKTVPGCRVCRHSR